MSGSVTRAAALEKSPQPFPFLSDAWFDAVEAFLAGKLLVKRDLTPLLGLQSLVPDLDDVAAEHGSFIAQLEAITAQDAA